jgi:membrane-associated phospholipid phosphatase
MRKKSMGVILVVTLAFIKSLYAVDPIEEAGNVLLYTLPTIAVATTVCNKDYHGLLQLGLSEALNEGITFGLKVTTHELRPNHSDYLSFPSGHASTTFTVAGFLWKRYGWEYGVPSAVLSSFTAYSRVESKYHYVHDVVAGAAIGLLSSYLFARPFHDISVQAIDDKNKFGIVLVFPLK